MEALAQTFDICERTVLSKTDNLNSLFWQRKASATTDKAPAHLLRLFGFHYRTRRSSSALIRRDETRTATKAASARLDAGLPIWIFDAPAGQTHSTIVPLPLC